MRQFKNVIICMMFGLYSAAAMADDSRLHEVFTSSSRVGAFTAGTKTWNFSNRTGTTPQNACSRIRKGGKTSHLNSFVVLSEFHCQVGSKSQTFILIHALSIERINAKSEIFLVNKSDVFLDE